MTNWHNVVLSHHAWAHKDDDYKLVMQPSAADATIHSLTEQTGFPITAEFREFYNQINGFGVAADGQKTSWLLVPVERIEATIARARAGFEETHPELAKRFFPFIDWDSGDYSGYFTAEDGSLLPGLYDFDHETYEFDEEQASEEVVTKGDASILEFLNGR